MAFNITLNKKLARFDEASVDYRMTENPELFQQLKDLKLVRAETTIEDYNKNREPIGTKGTGWNRNFLTFKAITNAIKDANPGMSEVDFSDFGYDINYIDRLDYVKNSLTKGQKFIPKIEMRLSGNPDIVRMYNEDSKLFKFTLNAPDINDIVAEAITIENIGEITWDDYEKVDSVLNGFVNEDRGLKVKAVSENENSRYLHLVFLGHNELTSGALCSVTMDWNDDLRGIPLLSFHFTRAEVENKTSVVLENSNITVSKDSLLTNAN